MSVPPESKISALKSRWLSEPGQRVRERLIQCFRESDEAWGRHLADFPYGSELGPDEDLRGIDLSGLDLTGMMAAYVNLEDANISRCTFRIPVILSGGRLRRARCNGLVTAKKAQLSSIVAEDADFSEADLSYAFMMSSTLKRCNFTSARLVGTALESSLLDDSTFENATLTNAKLEFGSLKRVCFRNADLRGADLTYCDLTGADFRGANLTQAMFDNANLTDALFSSS
jgi:uncharacterized protein YjbI with pentapeptide repeats